MDSISDSPSDLKSTSPLYPADNPAVIAHVTLIQTIIGRLANASASCKKAYRDLHEWLAKSVRDGSYGREHAFQASAPPAFEHYMCALTSWSVIYFYLGLIVLYCIVRFSGLMNTA